MIQTIADGLLADTLEHPDDDTPRLIFADWLEDNGEPERAEFIRLQLELAEFRLEDCLQAIRLDATELDPQNPDTILWLACGKCSFCQTWQRKQKRSRTLLPWAFPPRSTLQDELGYTIGPVPGHWHSQDVPGFYLRRGFVESLVCKWSWWKWHDVEITQTQPLRQVYLKNLPQSVSWPSTTGEVFFSFDRHPHVTISSSEAKLLGFDLVAEARRRFLVSYWPGLQFVFPPSP